jgi:hypothetical protein
VEPVTAENLEGTFFQLQQGRLIPISEKRQPVATAVLPWTVQERITSLVSIGERVYLGVNGFGVAETVVPTEGLPSFNYFYDPLLFRYRTLTTLIPEQDSLLCHLYFNKLLNVVSQTDLKLQGISLLRLFPSTGIYQFLTPPYQEAHPDWEAVGFVPAPPHQFYIQWKYSDRNRTLFSYSHFDPTELTEREIGEQSYRRSYGFQAVEEGSPAAMKELLAKARSHLDVEGVSTGYQIHIRAEEQALVRRFEYHPPDFTSAEEIRLYTLYGARSKGRILLLLPDGLLLRANTASGLVEHYRLPTLPTDTIYTDMLQHGQHLLAGWEQTAFTDVGAAGFFLAKIP